jgi:hypothetical protein
MVDAIQRQVELERMQIGAAELAPVVGQHVLELQPELGIEGQQVVVDQRHGRLGLFAGVQEAERIAVVGVHGAMQVDPSAVLRASSCPRP